MKDLRWPHAFVIAVVLLVFGGLALAGRDSAAVLGGVIALLGAMGFLVKGQAEVKEQAAAIKEQTNGNTTALYTLVRELQQQIADQHHTHQEQMLQLANKLAEMAPPAADTTYNDD